MTKPNAFAGLGKMMKTGSLQQLLTAAAVDTEASFSRLALSEIKLFPQQRETLEVEGEQTLAELAQDIKAQGVIQPIVVCEMPEEEGKRWRLVAGERRYRGATLAELSSIPAMVYGPLTEDQISRIQYAENVHRLNLSTLNEAKILQQDMAELGSLEAVCQKRNKSQAWVSKRLSLLNIGPESQRIITDNVSNDLEVILAVNQVEKVDPQQAAQVVKELKELQELGTDKGGNARKIARDAKDKVKPKKEKAKPAPQQESKPADDAQGSTAGSEAKRDEEQLGLAMPPKKGASTAEQVCAIYWAIRLDGAQPEQVVETLGERRKAIEDFLTPFYERGVETETDIAGAVFQGFLDRSFGTADEQAVCLSAFLLGLEPGASFSLAKILASLAK